MVKRKSSENYKKESRESFDRLARAYDQYPVFAIWRSLYLCIIEKLSQNPHRAVLDVGCGTGTLLSIISKEKDIKLTGIDISPEMIRVAEEKLSQRAELVVGDAGNLPWNDGSFDTIVSTLAFHHFPRPHVALKEMKRVLVPNGLLIIGDVWLPSPLRQIANILLPFSPQGDVRIYSRNELTSLLSRAGFSSISWETVGFISQLVTATSFS